MTKPIKMQTPQWYGKSTIKFIIKRKCFLININKIVLVNLINNTSSTGSFKILFSLLNNRQFFHF